MTVEPGRSAGWCSGSDLFPAGRDLSRAGSRSTPPPREGEGHMWTSQLRLGAGVVLVEGRGFPGMSVEDGQSLHEVLLPLPIVLTVRAA